MNENGHPDTLRPPKPGNTNAVKTGIYSATGRVLQPRAEEIAKALMDAPHVVALDNIAAEEIGALLAHIEAIDNDLATRPKAKPALVDMRARLTRQLRDWLREFGATPKSRADWAKTMAEGGLADALARSRRNRQEDPE